jgi:two-component system, OmpR family, copper resistance phosphate regulon response regulator CusR
MKILIIEDEPKVSNFLRQGLEEEGFHVDVAENAEQARGFFTCAKFDILLLDLILPDASGNDLCRDFKALFPDTPVLMLTALGSLQDKLDGFESGADDYLVKPFEFRELLARIHVLTKRTTQKLEQNKTIVFHDLELDLHKKMARRAGKDILLSAKEFALLELFMNNQGKVLSRAEIAEKIWEITFDTGTNVVDVYINLLRKKIDRDFPSKYIHTRIGMGYIFQEE